MYFLVTVQILTTTSIKMAILWGVTSCSPVEIYRRFGGVYYFHHTKRRSASAGIHGATFQRVSSSICSLLASVIYGMLDNSFHFSTFLLQNIYYLPFSFLPFNCGRPHVVGRPTVSRQASVQNLNIPHTVTTYVTLSNKCLQACMELQFVYKLCYSLIK